MKKTIKTMAIVLMTVFSLLISNDVSANTYKAEGGINTTKKTVTVNAGEKVTLKVAGSYKKYTFKSNNKKVATVTKKGVVKGKKAGTATVTAKSKKKVYKFKVKVVTKSKDVFSLGNYNNNNQDATLSNEDKLIITPNFTNTTTSNMDNLADKIKIEKNIHKKNVYYTITNEGEVTIPCVIIKSIVKYKDIVIVEPIHKIHALIPNSPQVISVCEYKTKDEIPEEMEDIDKGIYGVDYKDVTVDYTISVINEDSKNCNEECSVDIFDDADNINVIINNTESDKIYGYFNVVFYDNDNKFLKLYSRTISPNNFKDSNDFEFFIKKYSNSYEIYYNFYSYKEENA